MREQIPTKPGLTEFTYTYDAQYPRRQEMDIFFKRKVIFTHKLQPRIKLNAFLPSNMLFKRKKQSTNASNLSIRYVGDEYSRWRDQQVHKLGDGGVKKQTHSGHRANDLM